MKNSLIILFIISMSLNCYSQGWSIGDQTCIGGTNYDGITGSIRMSNGFTLMYGSSNSDISGNKTEPNIGGIDIWLISIDENQQILWQKTIGGFEDDLPTKIIETEDHSLLLLASSMSGIGGNKTTPNYGDEDIWLLKLDLTGQILWQKNYGGDLPDGATDLKELQSNNILICGTSHSGISGTKTSSNIGGADVWLLKTDQNGEILDDNSIGGTGDDYFSAEIKMLNTYEFILPAESSSDISGDKTENSYGESDFWICRIDTNFNIIQQRTIGGSSYDEMPHIELGLNGDIILIGTSTSPISGLKTENYFGTWSQDCWMLKLNLGFGIISQKTIGSNNNDIVILIQKMNNGNYIVGTRSDSDVNMYKSESNLGSEDLWFFIVDENLNFIDDKTIGSSSREYLGSIIETSLNNFTVFAASNGSDTGDKTCAGYNTGLYTSPTDGWIFTLETSVGIDEVENKIGLFPNPVQYILSVNSDQEISLVLIRSLDGKIVLQQKENNMNTSINVESIPSGIYLSEIQFSNGEIKIERFVKE